MTDQPNAAERAEPDDGFARQLVNLATADVEGLRAEVRTLRAENERLRTLGIMHEGQRDEAESALASEREKVARLRKVGQRLYAEAWGPLKATLQEAYEAFVLDTTNEGAEP